MQDLKTIVYKRGEKPACIVSSNTVIHTLVATLSITVIFVEGEHIKGVKNVFYVHSQGALCSQSETQ